MRHTTCPLDMMGHIACSCSGHVVDQGDKTYLLIRTVVGRTINIWHSAINIWQSPIIRTTLIDQKSNHTTERIRVLVKDKGNGFPFDLGRNIACRPGGQVRPGRRSVTGREPYLSTCVGRNSSLANQNWNKMVGR